MTNDKQTNNNVQTTYFSRTKDGHACLHAINNAFGRQVLELPRYLQLLSNFHPNSILKMKSISFNQSESSPSSDDQLIYLHNIRLFAFLLKNLSIVHQLSSATNLESFEESLDKNSTTGLLCVSPHGVWSARKMDHSAKKWLLLDSSRFKPIYVSSSQLWDAESQYIIIPFSHLFSDDVANDNQDNQETSSNGSGSSKTKTKKMRKVKSAPVVLSLSSHNLALYNRMDGNEDLSRDSSYATSESSLEDQPESRFGTYSNITLPRPNRFVVLYHLSPNI